RDGLPAVLSSVYRRGYSFARRLRTHLSGRKAFVGYRPMGQILTVVPGCRGDGSQLQERDLPYGTNLRVARKLMHVEMASNLPPAEARVKDAGALANLAPTSSVDIE